MEIEVKEFINNLFKRYINDEVNKNYQKNEKSPDVIFINKELFNLFSLKNVYMTTSCGEKFVVPSYNVSGISFENYYGN